MSTFIVGSLVIGAFLFVILNTINKKKKGESSCGSCSGCANSSYCHEKKIK